MGKQVKSNRLGHFVDFLYAEESSSGSSLPELKRELESQGVNVARINASVNRILVEVEKAGQLGWLERARAKREIFEAKLKDRSEKIARKYGEGKELLEAMLAGQLGVGLQAKAQVFFRNQKVEEMSPNDLRSFIHDCELLDLLDKEEDQVDTGSDEGRDDEGKA